MNVKEFEDKKSELKRAAIQLANQLLDHVKQDKLFGISAVLVTTSKPVVIDKNKQTEDFTATVERFHYGPSGVMDEQLLTFAASVYEKESSDEN